MISKIQILISQISWFFWATLVMIFFYAINVACGVKVVKFVAAHTSFNPGIKVLNQQLTKSLIILVWN
jgi:hypothetical protein